MAAPRNPYRQERGFTREAPDMSALHAPDVAPPIEGAVGLHSIDLHNLAVRNFRAGVEQERREAALLFGRLREERATAWDEGLAAGEQLAEQRALDHFDPLLRLIRARTTPTRGKATVTELQARLNAIEQLVDGALAIVSDRDVRTVDDADAAEASGMTVKGFALLEKLLIEAAEREGAHEQPLED